MCTGDLNGVGAVARVLNGEDGLVSRFSRPIDPCSGGATGAQNYHSRASPCLHSRGHQPCDDHASVCNRRAGAPTCFGRSPQPAGTFDELILIAGSTRSALRPWQPGAHRRRPSSAPSTGSGGLVCECAARN